MKTSTPNDRRTRSDRSPKHRIPIGLQIAARIIDGQDCDSAYLLEQLTKADRRAAHLLHDPLRELADIGPEKALDALADDFGATAAAERIAAAIPPTLTHDPHSWLADHAVPWQQAGLFLGLCLGFRIAAGIGGKE